MTSRTDSLSSERKANLHSKAAHPAGTDMEEVIYETGESQRGTSSTFKNLGYILSRSKGLIIDVRSMPAQCLLNACSMCA